MISEGEIGMSDEANREQKLICIPLLFALLEEMFDTRDNDQTFTQALVNVCSSWLRCDLTSVAAMKVLSKVFGEFVTEAF